MSIRLNSKDRILRAIQIANPDYTFSHSDIIYHDPVALPEGHEHNRNTSLYLTSNPTSPKYILDQTIFYNRNDLAIIFDGAPGLGELTEFTDEAAIAHINALFGTNLTIEDVYVVEFQEGYEGQISNSITLRARTLSLGYIGEKSFAINDQRIPLYVAIANNILDGLEYPVVIFNEPGSTFVDTPLSPAGVAPNGRMYTGTGNSVEGFYIMNNGTLELGFALRKWKSNATLPIDQESNSVLLALAPNEDWSIPLSVVTVGEAAGTRPTASYDVYWKVRNVGTGEEIVWELRDSDVNEGHIDWVCTSHEFPNETGNVITDNASDDDWSVVQNIQRLSFYRNTFPESASLSESPFGLVGEYVVELSAREKDAVGTLHKVEARINVSPLV